MAKYEIAEAITGRNESGWVNDGDDGGEETYNGVSRKYHPTCEIWSRVDAHKPLKKGQVIKDDILDEMISKFYKKNFWDVIHGDEIANQNMANQIYDMGVNAGIPRALSIAQESLGLKVTGKMTPELLSSLKGENSI